MDKSQVTASLASMGLARIVPDLTRLLQPSIRLAAAPAAESSLPIGGSKLGGLPDLPKNTTWPTGKGAPLAFIAQIRLDDLTKFEAAQVLPRTGILSFFYDASQQTYGADPADRGGWEVLFLAPDAALLERMPAPDRLPATARYTPCALTFSEEPTLPQDPKLDLPSFDWTQAEQTQYEQVLSRFPSPADRATMHHRLLGNPDTIQDDMRLECQLASHGVSSMDDPRANTFAKDAMNWRLLLQVDSDDKAGMRWANAGMLYYWIEEAALQALQFDHAWVVLQSE